MLKYQFKVVEDVGAVEDVVLQGCKFFIFSLGGPAQSL